MPGINSTASTKVLDDILTVAQTLTKDATVGDGNQLLEELLDAIKEITSR